VRTGRVPDADLDLELPRVFVGGTAFDGTTEMRWISLFDKAARLTMRHRARSLAAPLSCPGVENSLYVFLLCRSFHAIFIARSHVSFVR
jgi:hypothetical protein